MQIKSWQIALLGSIPFLSMIILNLLFIVTNGYDRNTSSNLILMFILFIIILIPILFLKNKSLRMNKIGALASIILGLLLITYLLNLFLHATGPDLVLGDLINFTVFIFFFSAIIFLIAGIYYFKKESKS